MNLSVTFATIISIITIIFTAQFQLKILFRGRILGVSESSTKSGGLKATRQAQSSVVDDGETRDLETLKELYYRLHNLEDFPEVLPEAKRLLISLLEETSKKAQTLPIQDSILSVRSFSRHGLEDFQRRQNNDIGNAWEEYNLRRKEGGPRELFLDREEAIWWLKQLSPVKFVDGAWLGHIGNVTTPFALLKTVKSAWQILSEELGDGDLRKNHVHLYHKLLEGLSADLPQPETLDFGHSRHQLNELSVWKSAIAQLLISLFPQEFLPEILGFNLHFEAISMDTLKAGMELKEVGIDPYYFLLHISIDNTHSGHSAIAIEVVCEYMCYILKSEGEAGVQQAWRKLQSGYLLSSCLPGTVVCPSRRALGAYPAIALSPMEAKVISIFRAKAQVSRGIHCSSRIKIGSRSIGDWLDPVALASGKWQKAFLDALTSNKYWIQKGNSSKSRFIQELQWNGRMFGSFTQDEFGVLKEWIDTLHSIPSAKQTSVATLHKMSDDNDGSNNEELLSGQPVSDPLLGGSNSGIAISLQSPAVLFTFESLPFLFIGDLPIPKRLLPLWLSHPCVLQMFVSVPWRTKNTLACTIIKILRAQKGFDIERECPAGMDEVQRTNHVGLMEIGTNMLEKHGCSLTEVSSLEAVLNLYPSTFAVFLLRLSMRPIENKALLIGMATAFAQMHLLLSESQSTVLLAQDKGILQKIALRELEGLKICWEELRLDKKSHADWCRGYFLVAAEVEKCFQP